MKNRIKLIEFLIKSIKMFDNVEDVLVYNKKNGEYYKISELYHICDSENKEYMIVEI